MRAEVGQQLAPLTVRVTRTDLVRYAGASGDFNPIHHSAWAAAQLGLPGVLAHGMLTMGLALRVVTAWAGPAAVRRYSARFTKPVVVPDDGLGAELHLTGQVTAVGEDSVTVSIDATCNGEKVLGQAVVEVAR